MLTLPKCRQGLDSTTQDHDFASLRRALERFRRTALKSFEVTAEDEVKTALEGVVDVLEYAIHEVRTSFIRVFIA